MSIQWMDRDVNDKLSQMNAREKDRIYCSFYLKIGACRHGNKCSRKHILPHSSRKTSVRIDRSFQTWAKLGQHRIEALISGQGAVETILLKNFYQRKFESSFGDSQREEQIEFDQFYHEVYLEISEKYGSIEEMNVCDNVGEHMLGNVYIRFRYENCAKQALEELSNRWFDRKPIHCEYSPVKDFRDACCRQNGNGQARIDISINKTRSFKNSTYPLWYFRECSRGGFCNFIHLKQVSKGMRRKISRELKWNRKKRKSLKNAKLKWKDDESLPKKYQNCSSSESSWSYSENELPYVDRSSTPFAFRADRYPSDLSSYDSETDPEIEAHKQFLRRQRWNEIRGEFLAAQKWDDDRERNFVFSLL